MLVREKRPRRALSASQKKEENTSWVHQHSGLFVSDVRWLPSLAWCVQGPVGPVAGVHIEGVEVSPLALSVVPQSAPYTSVLSSLFHGLVDVKVVVVISAGTEGRRAAGDAALTSRRYHGRHRLSVYQLRCLLCLVSGVY